MKIEKAIELFKNCDTVTFTVTGCGEESYQTIKFENVVEVLEKQASRKVNEITQYESILDGYCPCCQRYITSILNYCPDCGQCLDWEEEDE